MKRSMRNVCTECRGQGSDFEIECPDCSGTGSRLTDDGHLGQCHNCYGDGDIMVDECLSCVGTGFAQVS